jgi:hypothetical protein|nr:MAG TPA: hypothetical protein [Caudoviricetes sp.]
MLNRERNIFVVANVIDLVTCIMQKIDGVGMDLPQEENGVNAETVLQEDISIAVRAALSNLKPVI